MKITGAIFDMDGTLLNSMDYWAIASGEYLESLGIEPFDSCNQHFLEDGMKVWYETARSKGLEAPYDEVAKGIYDIMDKYYMNNVRLKDGALELLQRLKYKGVKMCLATATDELYVRKILTRLGIIDFFPKIFTSKTVGLGKRHPLIYEKSLEYLGTKKEETYVFEDAIYAIKTCNAAGFNVIGIYDKNAYAPKEEIKALCTLYLDEGDKYNFPID